MTTAEARKAARKNRLASTEKQSGAAPATQSDSSISKDATKVEASAPPAAAPPAPPVKDEPRELVAKVVDPARLDGSAAVTVAGPYNADIDNPHWVILANGTPMAQISLMDQDDPETIRKVFASDDYAKSLIQLSKRQPILKVLTVLKARPYIAAVKDTELFESLDKGYRAEAKAAFQTKAAQYRDDLSSSLMLVVEAQRKNFLVENPLKDTLFQQMRKAGVADPVPLIEAAFSQAWAETFETMLKQAQHWMDMSPEALAEIKQSVTQMPSRQVTAIALPPGTRAVTAAPAPAPAVPSQSRNVPLVAPQNGGHDAAPDLKETTRKVFSFRSRMHSKQLLPRG